MSVLVCVLPARGHVSPTLAVVADLVGVGHTVHVVTGRRYRDSFLRLGATVTLLGPDADFDDDDLDASFPRRSGLTGLRLARHDLIDGRPHVQRKGTRTRHADSCLPHHQSDALIRPDQSRRWAWSVENGVDRCPRSGPGTPPGAQIGSLPSSSTWG